MILELSIYQLQIFHVTNQYFLSLQPYENLATSEHLKNIFANMCLRSYDFYEYMHRQDRSMGSSTCFFKLSSSTIINNVITKNNGKIRCLTLTSIKFDLDNQQVNFKKFYFILILHLILGKVTKFLLQKLSTSEVISQNLMGGWKTPPPPPSTFRVITIIACSQRLIHGCSFVSNAKIIENSFWESLRKRMYK